MIIFTCILRNINIKLLLLLLLLRVGTQGLFRQCLKCFVAPFLPARLTAPGSPRMDCHTGYRSFFFFFKLLVAAVARAMQYAHRPPDLTMPVSGCPREINMRFDSLLLIESLPCTRRRKYFAVLLKWKAGHIVLYFLCV